MTSTFCIQLALSFVVGSLWTTLTTVIADRYGSKLGGWIGGMPTTVLISLLFIGIVQSPAAASQAALVTPFTVGTNGLFLIAYIYFGKKKFWQGIVPAFLVYTLFGILVIFFPIKHISISIILWLLLLALSIFLQNKIPVPSFDKAKVNYTPRQIIGRILFSGILVTAAVLGSKISGPVLGGIMAAFPAKIFSTLLISVKSRGLEFSRALAKTLMLSTVTNVAIYAVVVHFTYPYFGLIVGTSMSFAVCLLSAYCTYFIIRKKMS